MYNMLVYKFRKYTYLNLSLYEHMLLIKKLNLCFSDDIQLIWHRCRCKVCFVNKYIINCNVCKSIVL